MSVGVGKVFESVCLSVCLFVCLSVYLFVRSTIQKRMIPKCSNLVQGMTLRYTRISDMVWGVERSKVKVTRSITLHNHTSFQTTTALHPCTFARWRHCRAIRRGFELYKYILVHSVLAGNLKIIIK